MTQPFSASADILILSNGPGELVTWVRPVVLELRQHIPQARVSLILSPCPHASGYERYLAQEYVKPDRIQDADYFLTFLITNQTEELWDWAPRGVVVFLGGDQFYAVWIAKRLGYRVVVYAEHEPRWRHWVDAFGLRTPAILKKYGKGWEPKMQVVGDLMVDGVESASSEPPLMTPGWITGGVAPSAPQAYELARTLPNPGTAAANPSFPVEERVESDAVTARQPILSGPLLPRGWRPIMDKGRAFYQVALLPGSKATKLTLGVPLFLAVADELRQMLPNVQFVIPVAPGLSLEGLAAFAQVKHNPHLAAVYGTTGILEQTSVGSQLVTPFGSMVQLWTSFPAYSVLANCDLCLTTVGANTAELGCLNVPMVVVLPLNKPELIRTWDGILGLLVNLPGVGSLLARFVNLLAMRWLGLLAWPNIWANKEVVPEMRGHLRPKQIAHRLNDLLQDASRRDQMRSDLQKLGGGLGAARALVQIVEHQLAKAKPKFQRPSS